jgi:transposase InsO family protein
MSTTSVLLALRRFIARRGTPNVLISDNALSFKSAHDRIRNITKSLEFQKYLSDRKIEWRFIPNRAPWMGGFWERLIGLTKGCIHRSLGSNIVGYDEFMTVLSEIEAVLNSRPLTKASSDVNDLSPITPAHLMYGRPLPTEPITSLVDDDIDNTYGEHIRIRRTHIERLTVDAWRRFHQEYLSALRERHASYHRKPSTVNIGDVVQIYHEGPRMHWKTAVVEAVHRGLDGLVCPPIYVHQQEG